MKPLPSHPNIDQLKRQAKDLLAAVQRRTPEAMERFQASLPAAAPLSTDKLSGLRLHDAQSCIAREYGFASWRALRDFVEMARARSSNPVELAASFSRLAYAGDIAGGMDRSKPELAARYLALLALHGPLDPWIACATGDISVVQSRLDEDPSWIAEPGGPLGLPPLVSATHSGLIRLPEHRTGIVDTVALLLNAGADPNQSVGNRWPPASVEQPSPDHRLSALYGAAGVNHDADLTRLLLDAGADPNDNESLYHALEGSDKTIISLLLDAGAVVEGTNALYHALDFDDLETFRLLLAKTGTLDHPDLGPLLLWAIRRRRSASHIEAILAAGADPKAMAKDGTSAFVQALRYGLPEVADLLKGAGAVEELGDADLFLAACADANAVEAHRLQARNPQFPTELEEAQLKLLPELAAAGHSDAVRLMAELGWPLDIKGGDWNATALNHAVMRGDAALTRALIKHGSQWTDEHGFGDNACGTLSWASINSPEPDGDWVACAEALVAGGLPGAVRDPEHPDRVLMAGVRRHFSDAVTQYLLSVRDGP
ncbi:MAG: ankyrin repeat domain-containing protein [Pseudomonadota bacterium]